MARKKGGGGGGSPPPGPVAASTPAPTVTTPPTGSLKQPRPVWVFVIIAFIVVLMYILLHGKRMFTAPVEEVKKQVGTAPAGPPLPIKEYDSDVWEGWMWLPGDSQEEPSVKLTSVRVTRTTSSYESTRYVDSKSGHSSSVSTSTTWTPDGKFKAWGTWSHIDAGRFEVVWDPRQPNIILGHSWTEAGGTRKRTDPCVTRGARYRLSRARPVLAKH